MAIGGKKNVPYKQPVILAPNHTNAFVDPAALGMSLPCKIRFFARGDVFKGAIAKWALNNLSISPMYRIQEGYSELKKNDKTFEECRNLLSNNKTILLFPEAICIQEKRLQPLKKGLTRIVFQTEELFDFKKNVWIVPIGMNYSNAKKFGSRLYMNIGKPISIKQYEDAYKQDKVKAINEFTKMLEVEMTKLIIVIDNKENDKLVEDLTEIYLHDWLKSKGEDTKDVEKQYYASKEIAEMVNYIDKNNQSVINTLREESNSYLRQLNKHNLRDHLLRPESINHMNGLNFFLDFMLVWLGMPIYAIGLLTSYPAYAIAKNFADKKIKKAEFYSSIYANMSMVLWVVFYGIQLLAVALIFRNWTLLGIYALLVPAVGYYSLWYYRTYKKAFGRLRLLRMVRTEKKAIEQLLSLRGQLMADVAFAKKEFLNSKQFVSA